MIAGTAIVARTVHSAVLAKESGSTTIFTLGTMVTAGTDALTRDGITRGTIITLTVSRAILAIPEMWAEFSTYTSL